MDLKEKMDFISEHHSSLRQEEISEINRLYRKIYSRRRVEEEKIEVLSEALFTYSEAMSKKMVLIKLDELFSQYMREKGLKQSLIKVDEVSSMISSDIRENNTVIENTNFLISGIQDMLKNQQT